MLSGAESLQGNAGLIIRAMPKGKRKRSANSQPLQNMVVIVLLTLAVLIVLGQANPLTTRLGRDSGMYAYVASHLVRGDTPYVSAWEHKPPGIFFIDALGLSLTGGSRWGIWLVEFVSLTLAAMIGFRALKKHFGAAPALVASFVWLGGLGLVLEGGNFTEEFSLPFAFASLLLFGLTLDRPASAWLCAGLGLAAGCTFMLRPNNAGVQIAIVFTELALVLRGQRAWRETLLGWAALAAGFAIPLAAAVVYFLSRGALAQFFEAAILFNLAYGGRSDLFGAVAGGIKHLGFAAGLGLAGLVVAFSELLRQFRTKSLDPVLLWLGIAAVLEAVLSGLSGRNYPHYFILWLPWIAFGSALLFTRLAPQFNAWYGRFAVPVVLVAIAALSAASLGTLGTYALSVRELAVAGGAAQRQDQLSSYINDRTVPGETVYVWGGEAGINFLSRRDAPTAHFSYAQLGPSPQTERLSREFYEDIAAHPPALILDMAGDEVPTLATENPVQWLVSRGLYATPYLQEFFDFVHANYSYSTSVAGVPVYALER